MKKILFGLVAIPLIAMSSLSYAEENEFIVHDEEDGTITVYSQDKSYGITIQDKNLGASVAGTGEESYGYYFQWGNNHGNYAGTNTGTKNELLDDDVNQWVNKGYSGVNDKFIIFDDGNKRTYDYWSGVFYNNATNNSYTGDSPYNNLWGGGNDNDDGSTTIVKGYNIVTHVATNVDNRQGPCPTDYHVPSAGEWNELVKLYAQAKGYTLQQDNSVEYSRAKYLSSAGYGKSFKDDLLLPFAGYRDYRYGTAYGLRTYAYYWSSSPRGGSDPRAAWHLYLEFSIVNPSSYDDRGLGYAVRCFKNSYIPLPKTLNLVFMSDDEVWSGGVLSGDTIPGNIITQYLTGLTKQGYTFNGWTISGTQDIFNPENDIVTTGLILNADWTINQYTITFDTDGGNDIAPITGDYGTGITKPADPTRNGYIFDGRDPAIPDTMPAENLTIKAKRTKKSSGGSSGGGGSMRKDSCPNGDLSPSYYDGTCEGDNTQDFYPTSGASAEPQNDITPLTGGDGEARGGYSQEFLNAYERAFKNGITTMNTIDKANMDGYIKRGHLAKMVVNYVTNVLGREIPSDIPASCLSFNDESTARESEEIKDYAIKSCALGLMGINMKNNEFLPNDYVPRSQFGAVLSRILRGDKYNLVHTQEKPRYTDHLNALKEEGIMTKIDNPQMQEKRGYVMIMLMRSVK